jgi:hypothetical protein
MNRRARRGAKKGDAIFVDWGHLSERDQNYGLPVICYVCGAPHKAFGLARITEKSGTTHVPLCEPCLASTDRGNAVIRKFWNVRDLEISEGGEATTEQVMALTEKQDETEH